VNSWYALSSKPALKQTEISIFDEVGMWGVSAKQFITDLQAVPADHSILLRIHSPGGEVFDGNAIFTALQRRGNVEVQIEGLAASMATVISLAGVPVRMAANGFYMIHNPWGVAMGDAAELRDQAQLLDKIRSNMVGAYAAKSSQTPEQIQQWMDAETWFTADEAKAAGFVDEVTDSLAMAASASKFSRLAKYRNAPADLTARAQQMENPSEPEIVAEEPVLEETPEATVVSESAPVEQPVIEPEAELEKPEEPAAPVALAAADSILAKYNAIAAERDSIRAELVAAKGQLSREREALARLEASLGLAPARVVPEIENASPEAADPVAEYIAAVESGDRKKAASLFEKHKAAIWQHRNKISKA
jgi:ATP-dependent Clp endopeptidase proteolytic subunit ClpP